MHHLRPCALFVTTLLLLKSFSLITSLSGILNVTLSETEDFDACHNCLISSLGIKQIHLIAAARAFRLYWVEGHSDTMTAFLSYCSNRVACVLSDQLQQTKLPANEMKATRYRTQQNELESVHSLASSMHEAIVKWSDGSTTSLTESIYEVSSLIWKESSEIPMFFWDDELIRDPLLLKHYKRKEPKILIMSYPAVLNSKMPVDDHVNTQYGKTVESLMRCMILPFTPQEAVCRECMAMHSKWFAVRSIHLYHTSKKRSADVCVFHSNYSSSLIVANCDKVFCPAIKILNSIDCHRLHDIFFISHPNADDKNKLQQEELQEVLTTIAGNRMARRHKVDGVFQEAVASLNSFNILHAKEYVCIKVSTQPILQWQCISCVLKDVKGYRIVIFSSLYSTLIFTDTIKPMSSCFKCRMIELLHPDDCRQNLAHHSNNLEVYPKPSNFEMHNRLDRACFTVYHTKSDARKCPSCIKSFLGITNEAQLIRQSPLLFDISMSKWNATPNEFRNLLSTCVRKYKCTRIQNVPNIFCMHHRDFIMARLTEQSKADTFTHRLAPVGAWPSLSMDLFTPPRRYSPHSSPAYSSQIWPVSGDIALVVFTYADFELYHCLHCLAEHTEIFFFYRNEVAHNGYVWMRPESSTVLSVCVGKYCQSLSHGESVLRTRRPCGLRQLTNVDIKSSVRFSPGLQ